MRCQLYDNHEDQSNFQSSDSDSASKTSSTNVAEEKVVGTMHSFIEADQEISILWIFRNGYISFPVLLYGIYCYFKGMSYKFEEVASKKISVYLWNQKIN